MLLATFTSLRWGEVTALRRSDAFAACSGARLKDLMARMGHDSECAAMIYQHEARGAGKTITSAIDAHIEAEQAEGRDSDAGQAGTLAPHRLMAREDQQDVQRITEVARTGP